MMRMSFLAIMMFFSGDFVSDVLNAPPRDLASLLNPEHVLTQAGVAVDEDALIAALSAEIPLPTEEAVQQAIDDLVAEDPLVRRRAQDRLMAAREHAIPLLAKAADSQNATLRATALDLLTRINEAMNRPQAKRDDAYVRKLFAIRQLEKMKSRKALPALQGVAEGDDITLADAAAQAVAAINGEPVAAPDTRKALEEIAGRLPDNVGFVGVLDFSRNRSSRTLVEIVAPLLRNPEKQPLLQAMGGADVEEMIGDMQEEVGGGILDVISHLGNLRADAAVMMTSDNLPDRSGYVAWIVKGMCDPDRFRGVLAAETREEDQYTIGEHVVYGDRGDVAVCVLDKHTVVIAAGPRQGARLAMHMLLTALDREKERPLPPHVRKAFDLVFNDGHALAVSGALSDLQKAFLDMELDRALTRAMERQVQNPRPDRLLEIAGLRTILNLQGVEAFTGVVGEKAVVTLQAECESPESAALLDKSLADLHKQVQAMFAQAAAEMPAERRAMFGLDAPDIAFWQATLENRTLTVTVDMGSMSRIGMFAVRAERPRPAQRQARLEAARREAEARAAAEAARLQALEAEERARQEAAAARAHAEAAEMEARDRRAAEEERRKAIAQ